MGFEKEFFEKVFMNGWNQHKIDELLELYSDDIVYIHQGEEPRVVQGKTQFRNYLEGLWKTIPDFEFQLVETVWNTNVGFGEWIGSGTFHGKRYGMKDMDKPIPIQYKGVDVLVLDDQNLIKEERAYYNMLDILKQLQ